jgi:predicted nucleic acid-binding protein
MATYKTNAILTPIYGEFMAGVTNREQLQLSRWYLAQFEVLDRGRILSEDWRAAIRMAERIPRNGKPRQLTDCLIRAIANRLRRRVVTRDVDFPK